MIRDSNKRIALNEGEIRKALGNSDTQGLVLFTIALYLFGEYVMGDPEEGIDAMDPAEMWADLHSHYGTWVTEEGENRLNAVITGLTGGMFWKDLDVFMAVSTALFDGDMGDMVDVGFEELSATELMWAILEMGLVWDAEEVPEFSLNIQEYIEETLRIEQEDQDQNMAEIETSYLSMLEQLRHLGVPTAVIRAWDEEYAAVVEDLGDGTVG